MVSYLEQLLDCILLFHLFSRFMRLRGSASKVGDNVMARLHIMCPGPGNTSSIYNRIPTGLRSLAIILCLSNSTIMTSTIASVCTNIASYEAIHRCMPLQL